jgi:hypothetical protein
MSERLRVEELDEFFNKILDERPAGVLCAAPGNGDCSGNALIIGVVAWICSLPSGEEKSRLIKLLGAECFAPGKTFADIRLFVAKMCKGYASKSALANIRALGESLTSEGSDAFFETLAEWLHLGITVWTTESVGQVYGCNYSKNGTIHLVGGRGHFDAWVPNDQYDTMIQMLAESGTNVQYNSNPLRDWREKVLSDLAKGQELQALLLSLANSMNSANPEKSHVVDINNDNNDNNANNVIVAEQPAKPPQWVNFVGNNLKYFSSTFLEVYFDADPMTRLVIDQVEFYKHDSITAAKLAKKRK